MRLHPKYDVIESILKQLDESDLVDEFHMPLINFPIVQNNLKLLDIFLPYQKSDDTLCLAIKFDRFEIADRIVEWNCNDPELFYREDGYHMYPIQTAYFSERYIEWIAFFHKHGMDFNHAYSPLGKTCFHYFDGLSINKAREIIYFLVQVCGADINAVTNVSKRTMIFEVHKSLVYDFVKLGGNLDIRDVYGKMYLDYVYDDVKTEDIDLVHFCLENMYDINYHTPLYRDFHLVWKSIEERRKKKMFEFLFLDNSID